MKTNPSSLACIAGIFFGCMKVCFFGKNEYILETVNSIYSFTTSGNIFHISWKTSQISPSNAY